MNVAVTNPKRWPSGCELAKGWRPNEDRTQCPDTCRHRLTKSTWTRKHQLPTVPAESCALDVIERCGPLNLSDIGAHLGFSRERARQIESDAMRRIKREHPEVADYLVDRISAGTLGEQVQNAAPDLSGIYAWELSRHVTRRFKELGWSPSRKFDFTRKPSR